MEETKSNKKLYLKTVKTIRKIKLNTNHMIQCHKRKNKALEDSHLVLVKLYHWVIVFEYENATLD